MNPLLLRQFGKVYSQLNSGQQSLENVLNNLPAEIRDLLQRVDKTYNAFDADRNLAERSIELSSQEMLALNRKVREEAERQREIVNELRKATEVLRPDSAKTQEWLSTPDEAIYLANTLSKLIAQEKKLEQAKDDFISIAAHKLRTPLGSMRWDLEMMLHKENLDEKLKAQLDRLYKSNLRILDLANELLNVTRIDQGKIDDNPSPTNVLQVIRDVASELEAEAKEHQISITLEVPEGHTPQVTIDQKHFREVIENLVSNAVKYNRQGGKVTVIVAPEADRFKIGVSDTGMGIPASEQARVFTKFYRAQNAASSNTTGSGLGLFVVKSYIEAWGGKISFESSEEEGTTFHVEIPYEIKYTAKEELPATHAEGVAQIQDTRHSN